MSRFHLSVITMLLTLAGCTSAVSHVVTRVNHEAALVGDRPGDPLQWGVITVGANPEESTMSTLFGNDIAVQYSRKASAGNYPPGSVLSFVTWRQQEDGLIRRQNAGARAVGGVCRVCEFGGGSLRRAVSTL